MKHLIGRFWFWYSYLFHRNFRALINLDPKYLIPSQWDDCLNHKLEPPLYYTYVRVKRISS